MQVEAKQVRSGGWGGLLELAAAADPGSIDDAPGTGVRVSDIVLVSFTGHEVLA